MHVYTHICMYIGTRTYIGQYVYENAHTVLEQSQTVVLKYLKYLHLLLIIDYRLRM